MDISDKNRRIFEDARDHLNQADQKNMEQFDKAILSLSSAGLALSISFSKFIAPIESAKCLVLLKISWVAFGLAIVATVISFLTSSIAIKITRDHIYKYYMEGNNEFENKRNVGSIFTFWLNLFAAVVFILGIITTVTYVNENIQMEEIPMSKKMAVQQEEKGYVPPKNEPKPSDTGQSGQSQSNGSGNKK